MALLVMSVMPAVLADGDDDFSGDVVVFVGEDNDAPTICTDTTQRSWNPNDQTYYTAELYGDSRLNDYGDKFYNVAIRGDYVFTGETVTYYVIVQDENGEDDIDSVILQKNNLGVGSCSEIDTTELQVEVSNFDDCDFTIFDDATMNLYRCRLIVQDGWGGDEQTPSNNEAIINIKATDKGSPALSATTLWSDSLTINPPLNIDLSGQINFGSVEPGETVTSNTAYLSNVGSDGVVMDMYIASSDYFTDPNNPLAICGLGNGIPYTAFSYRATKGSLDSGSNNNGFPGLGAIGKICRANTDEFTPLPSHSGEIEDMCRIINHLEDASLLPQGQSMSLTFQLDVPTPCEGSFTKGKFHFAGRVV